MIWKTQFCCGLFDLFPNNEHWDSSRSNVQLNLYTVAIGCSFSAIIWFKTSWTLHNNITCTYKENYFSNNIKASRLIKAADFQENVSLIWVYKEGFF